MLGDEVVRARFARHGMFQNTLVYSGQNIFRINWWPVVVHDRIPHEYPGAAKEVVQWNIVQFLLKLFGF